MAHRQVPDEQSDSASIWSPGRPFYAGLAIVLLAQMIPLDPNWSTFIHMWRVEMAASIFLGCTLIYLFLNDKRSGFRAEVSRDEWKFIVLPLVAFITWSSLSILWAPSWKSALHHSLIWTEYLIFFLIFRHLIEKGPGFGKLLNVIVLTLLVYATPAIIEYCTFLSVGGSTTIGVRFAKYGEQIVTILPIVLLAVVRTRGKQFAIGATAASVLWLLIFCSMGRVNYLLFGFIIVAMFAGLIISKRHRRYLPRFALLAALFVLVLIPIHLFLRSAPDAAVPIVGRLADTATTANSDNFRKLMYSISKDMIRSHPVAGIGADNYGMQVNRYRAGYGEANPDDVNLVNAEDEIPSHAHNEFVQILAELGIVGGLIFAWFLLGLAVMAFRALREIPSRSLYPFAAVLGLGMFLASSLVSAYSFRVMQNGIVFFFVLAVAAKLLFKRHGSTSDVGLIAISPERRRLAFGVGIAACLGLLVYSGVRLTSVIVAVRANQTKTLEKAMPLYELAMRLDNENPDARQNLGMRLFRNRRYKEAIPYLESAISIGRAPSAELSYLATAKTLTGDPQGAEETMASAYSLYPRSPFVLTRYATVLESNGKPAESARIFDRALSIDERAANSWRLLIDSGPKSLGEKAARDAAGYSTVMDLRPKNSIYAVVTERLIRHPEEQKFSFGKVSTDED